MSWVRGTGATQAAGTAGGLAGGATARGSSCHALIGPGGRRQRDGVVNATAPVVRLPDLRQGRKVPEGGAPGHREWYNRRLISVAEEVQKDRHRLALQGTVASWGPRGTTGRIVLRHERRTCRERGGAKSTSRGLRASSAPEEVVDRNRAVFGRWAGRARSARGLRTSRSRCGPFDFRVVTLAALGRKSRVSIVPSGVRLTNTTAFPNSTGDPSCGRARLTADFCSKRKGRGEVLSSYLEVAAKNCVHCISSAQTPRPYDRGFWRALYLAFVSRLLARIVYLLASNADLATA